MKFNTFKTVMSIGLATILLLAAPAGITPASGESDALAGIVGRSDGGTETGTEDSTKDVALDNDIIKSKEEVVYAILQPEGGVRSIHVVNRFAVAEAGSITDYGDYTSVVNLTDTAQMVQDGDAVTVQTSAGTFYYQGNMTTVRLPWIFDISYYLDDVRTASQELAGKSGRLDIHITSGRNTDVPPVFYENYMLQISVTLDSEKCSDIKAPDAIAANAGKNKVITFTVMPGTDADVAISTVAKDFPVVAIDISAMPFKTNIQLPDTGDMFSDFNQLTGVISGLNEGMGKLADGIAGLKTGADKLANESADINAGLSRLSNNSGQLIHVSSQMEGSLSQIASTINSVIPTVLGDMPEEMGGSPAVMDLMRQLEQLAANLSELDKNHTAFHKGLSDYMNSVCELGTGYDHFHNGLASLQNGIGELHDGACELHGGSTRLSGEIAEMPDLLQEKMGDILDRFTGTDFEPVSFTSPKNRHTHMVQFVLKCDAIEKPREAKGTGAEVEKETFWDRLIALFKGFGHPFSRSP